MSEKIKELQSEGTLKNLQVKHGEIFRNIKDLQSKITEIYARDLQHTQLSGKVDSLQAWAIDMKGTLDKAVNAMKSMRAENDNTTASHRQRNNQRIRRSRVV